MIGLGTQDTFDKAKEFRTSRGVTFSLLWDGSGHSWRALGIRGQPAAVLFDESGLEIKRWFGSFNPQEVLQLARR